MLRELHGSSKNAGFAGPLYIWAFLGVSGRFWTFSGQMQGFAP
jgi:hypothetical protein